MFGHGFGAGGNGGQGYGEHEHSGAPLRVFFDEKVAMAVENKYSEKDPQWLETIPNDLVGRAWRWNRYCSGPKAFSTIQSFQGMLRIPGTLVVLTGIPSVSRETF